MKVGRLDWFFALPLIASLIMISEINPPREEAVVLSEFAKGGILFAITALLGLCVAAFSAVDRRCSEDYTFQIMANAALVAVATTMLINMIWLMGVSFAGLPDMSAENLAGVTALAMTVSYYWFRLRGIAR